MNLVVNLVVNPRLAQPGFSWVSGHSDMSPAREGNPTIAGLDDIDGLVIKIPQSHDISFSSLVVTDDGTSGVLYRDDLVIQASSDCSRSVLKLGTREGCRSGWCRSHCVRWALEVGPLL